MEVLDVFVKFLDSGVYCVFYYSGHGFRFHGFDYIMPIDVARELKCDECIPFNQIAYRLQRTLSKVIMLLDCCRVKLVFDVTFLVLYVYIKKCCVIVYMYSVACFEYCLH